MREGQGSFPVEASKREGGGEKLATGLIGAFLWRQGGGHKKKGICMLVECFLIYCKHK